MALLVCRKWVREFKVTKEQGRRRFKLLGEQKQEAK